MVIFPFPILFVARNTDFGVREAAVRLREIEDQVNALAGETLLRWENERGGIWPEVRKRRVEYIFWPLIVAFRGLAHRPQRPPSN
jgi:hypothetical protein